MMISTKVFDVAFSLCLLFSLATALLTPKHDTEIALKLKAATAIPIDAPGDAELVSSEKKPKIGVLLLNLGGPETGDDVEGMLVSRVHCAREKTIAL